MQRRANGAGGVVAINTPSLLRVERDWERRAGYRGLRQTADSRLVEQVFEPVDLSTTLSRGLSGTRIA